MHGTLKFADFFWDHPTLQNRTRVIKAGDFLFHQGEEAASMFVVIRGVGQLIAERDGKELVVGLIESGHFLGEKAIVEGRGKRFFAARAKSDMKVVELKLEDIYEIREKEPILMNDLLVGMFQIAAERLHAANHLTKILRNSNHMYRFIQLILHLAHFTGRKAVGGYEVYLTVDVIRYYIDMGEFEVEETLKELLRRRLIGRVADDFFLISNEKGLVAAIPQLKESLPSLSAI